MTKHEQLVQAFFTALYADMPSIVRLWVLRVAADSQEMDARAFIELWVTAWGGYGNFAVEFWNGRLQLVDSRFSLSIGELFALPKLGRAFANLVENMNDIWTKVHNKESLSLQQMKYNTMCDFTKLQALVFACLKAEMDKVKSSSELDELWAELVYKV